MRMRLAGLVAATLLLVPAAASAQFHDGYGDRGHGFHVDRYHHGDHDDVVIHRERPDFDRHGFHGERGHHHHHHHDDDDE